MMEPEKSFSIAAKTCTLKYNSQNNGDTIFSGDKRYVIPIYQRPYSWTEDQIRKFLSNIFSSYWDNEQKIIEEPMFIGTMQLTERKKQGEQDVIDGQQRLTTFLILLKILKHKFDDIEELKSIPLDWLSTKVNNGKQQIYLEETLNSDLTPNDETLNPYLKNAFLINEVFEEETRDDNGSPIALEVNRFIKHLLSNVYFVVIETKAGLSKTLQIFNAINTTGLDLNGGDIFKIRMYEYLRDKKNMNENAFDEVSKLYEIIDNSNSQVGYKLTDIKEILGIYQFILIAKYNLPVTLYSYSTDTFYERLFDTVFEINQWEHFKGNVKTIDLSVEEIVRVINVRCEWESNWFETAEDACSYTFIEWSRYSRYWILIPIFLYRFKDEEDSHKKLFLFTKQLSKLYIIYSIRFLKAVNEIHSYTYSLIKDIINKPFDDVMKTLNQKIGNLEKHKGWGDFENALKGDIVYNAKTKNIICRLSAMLEEDYLTTDSKKVDEICKKLFDAPIDIEHIQAYHDIEESEREAIWKEWGNEINSIGNLVVLEQSINRSIRNYSFVDKRAGYLNSDYSIIQNILSDYQDWRLSNCNTRKEKEANKILDYIFESD